MEGLAADPGGVETAPIRHDIFVHNQPRKTKDQVMPLLLYDHEKQRLTSPIVYTLYGKDTDSKLIANFEIFTPTSAKGKTNTRNVKGAEVADSTKGLKTSGKCDVPLPINAQEASIYVFSATSGYTIVFVIVYRKDGQHIPDLEKFTVQEDDVFEGGLLFGHLKAKFRKNAEIGFVRTARVALPVVMSLEKAFQRLNMTELREPKTGNSGLDSTSSSDGNNPDVSGVIEVSDDDDSILDGVDADMEEAGGAEHVDQRKRSRSPDGHDGRDEPVSGAVVTSVSVSQTNLAKPKRSRHDANACAGDASSSASTSPKDLQAHALDSSHRPRTSKRPPMKEAGFGSRDAASEMLRGFNV